jgi:hypothetical protein
VFTDEGWGMEPRKIYSDVDRGAYCWHGPLREHADLAKLHQPRVHVDWAATAASSSELTRSSMVCLT